MIKFDFFNYPDKNYFINGIFECVNLIIFEGFYFGFRSFLEIDNIKLNILGNFILDVVRRRLFMWILRETF